MGINYLLIRFQKHIFNVPMGVMAILQRKMIIVTILENKRFKTRIDKKY